jgi:ParB-like chromosome segregation protein Spo0J
MEGAFNLPPAIFIEGDFFDGRHRLFAARMAGLSHFPVINLEEMKP